MISKVLICGGREFADKNLFDSTMQELEKWLSPKFCIIQGGARGADRMSMGWAFFKGCAMLEFRANWDFYGKRAGAVRNQWMLEYGKPDLVIAFPGGRGTQDMIQRAKKYGTHVWEI